MNYKSYTVYDEDDFFESYIKKRAQGHSPNELIEQPIIDDLLGNVIGKKILDLGCGDGDYGLQLLGKGAGTYHGIEGSRNMFQLAIENHKDMDSIIQHGDIEDIDFGQDKFDVVVSRLVFHYIKDLHHLFDRIRLSLSENGVFVFSVEHPVITSCYQSYHEKPKRGHWVVDDYFSSGQRINTWIGKDVIKYHRTLEEYWTIIKDSKFEVIDIKESKPRESNFQKTEDFKRRSRIPLFLMIKLKHV